MPSQFRSGGWTNIIHLTATGGNCCNYGDRTPAVWFHSSSTTATGNKLHICSSINGNGNTCFNPGLVVRRGQWATMEIKQYKEGSFYRYQATVNGVLVASALNKQAREFSYVKVYGSDKWYNTAQGSMRRLVIIPNTGNIIEEKI